MPRSKSFDVDDVLDRAVDLFWVNGYAATSMEDLVNHLGINRGSLYSTFGSKQELYELALERYLSSGRDRFAEMLTDPAVPLREVITRLLLSSAEKADHRGCLLVNTTMERNATDERCLELTSTGFDELRAILIAAFESRPKRIGRRARTRSGGRPAAGGHAGAAGHRCDRIQDPRRLHNRHRARHPHPDTASPPLIDSVTGQRFRTGTQACMT